MINQLPTTPKFLLNREVPTHESEFEIEVSEEVETAVSEAIEFKGLVTKTLPVLFGYIPLGGVYGLLFLELGYDWWWAPITSLFVYAGAAKYMSIALLSVKTPLASLFMATFLINIRHLFYGFSLLKRFSHQGPKKYYMIGALTDETYSLLTSSKPQSAQRDTEECFQISLINHCYWVFGTALGAFIGESFKFDTSGFSFVLTSLFVVLTVEQARSIKLVWPFIAAGIIGFASLAISKEYFLPLALMLSIITILLVKRPIHAR